MSSAKFFCDGRRMKESETPASLDVEEDEEFQIGIPFIVLRSNLVCR